MKGVSLTACLSLAALLATAPARAEMIIQGARSDSAPVPGASLSDVRLSVDLVVTGGLATFTFVNASRSPEASASMKSIVLDTFDDDTGQAVLWGGSILTKNSNVHYELATTTNLSGYSEYTDDAFPLAELSAKGTGPKKGLNPGEMLQVRFGTSLAEGAGVLEYLAAFGDGQDTGEYSIGFGAIDVDILTGGSLTGMNGGGGFSAESAAHAPEPGTVSLLLFGGLALLRRRRQQTT